jgi:hypothetical protein
MLRLIFTLSTRRAVIEDVHVLYDPTTSQFADIFIKGAVLLGVIEVSVQSEHL